MPVLEALEPRVLLDIARATPWVAGVTTTSVYVCLEATNNTQDAVVDYGLTGSYGSEATTENAQATDYGYYVHNVKLTGLAPNTEYHYKVTHGSEETSDYAFWTAPVAGTSAHWGFAADCRADTYTGDSSDHNAMAALIDSHDPGMMVYGGDLCYNGQYWPSWNIEWLVDNQEALNATTPWVNAVGNHEAWFPPHLTQSFTQSPDGDDYCFSFDYGDAHILVLSNVNNTTMPYGPGSYQWNFAAADLAASTAAWKIVAFHRPAYAWGSHGGDSLTQQMTTDIFEPNGVDIVLAGHDHFYQHNLVNEVHHMVIGTFGVSPSTPGSSAYTIYSEATLCFGIFDTTPTSLTLTTYRENGTVIETINLYKDATPPTVPAGLSATALNDEQIELSWTASSDPESGVDHYNIYRDGGLVGTTDQTTYTDDGLDEQTTYTYEVSAVNGDQQESAKSSPASATTTADTTAPTISSAAWGWYDEVNVVFSEPVEQATAEDAGNYVIYSSDQYVHVFSATRQADNRTVLLGVSELSETRT
ncbi:MAG: purple acid phosphatase family protein, partial [Planctomycetota bacterium]